MKNKKILNIGLIGCGVVGLRRIENLSNNFKLIGCADIKVPKKKFINKKKLFITSNWKKLINLKNLDAVIIATTHQLHTQIILECIKIGIHVFVEKPGGISAIETNRIISFYKKKKII